MKWRQLQKQWGLRLLALKLQRRQAPKPLAKHLSQRNKFNELKQLNKRSKLKELKKPNQPNQLKKPNELNKPVCLD
jgi:hypothetical protein